MTMAKHPIFLLHFALILCTPYLYFPYFCTKKLIAIWNVLWLKIELNIAWIKLLSSTFYFNPFIDFGSFWLIVACIGLHSVRFPCAKGIISRVRSVTWEQKLLWIISLKPAAACLIIHIWFSIHSSNNYFLFTFPIIF